MKNPTSPSSPFPVCRAVALSWAGVLLLGWLAGCAHKSPLGETTPATSSDPRSELRRLEQGLAAAKSRIEGRSAAVSEAADSPSAPTPMATGAGASGGRCEAVCQAGQEICSFSRRICQLASQINDSDSTRSCRSAEKDCQEASANCASCH